MSTAVYVLVRDAHTRPRAGFRPPRRSSIVHNDGALDRASLGARVVHVDAPGNVGFGAAVNLALPHVTTERVVLCNPDVGADAAALGRR